jgi:hypothetical protein
MPESVDDPMLKERISGIERRTGMIAAEFDAHWAGPHVPIVRRLPGPPRTLIGDASSPPRRNDARQGP